MIRIKNLQFQPLTFAMTDGKSLHLLPRETQTLPDDALTVDLIKAGKRGFISIDAIPTPKPSPKRPSTKRSSRR